MKVFPKRYRKHAEISCRRSKHRQQTQKIPRRICRCAATAHRLPWSCRSSAYVQQNVVAQILRLLLMLLAGIAFFSSKWGFYFLVGSSYFILYKIAILPVKHEQLKVSKGHWLRRQEWWKIYFLLLTRDNNVFNDVLSTKISYIVFVKIW